MLKPDLPLLWDWPSGGDPLCYVSVVWLPEQGACLPIVTVLPFCSSRAFTCLRSGSHEYGRAVGSNVWPGRRKPAGSLGRLHEQVFSLLVALVCLSLGESSGSRCVVLPVWLSVQRQVLCQLLPNIIYFIFIQDYQEKHCNCRSTGQCNSSLYCKALQKSPTTSPLIKRPRPRAHFHQQPEVVSSDVTVSHFRSFASVEGSELTLNSNGLFP